MLENQFITFTEFIPTDQEVAMPVRPNEDMQFFYGAEIYTIYIAKPDGSYLKALPFSFVEAKDGKYNLFTINVSGLVSGLVNNRQYRIVFADKDNQKIYYSNLLINMPDADISMLRYACKEPAFGFPFGKDKDGNALFVQQALPIKLNAPQYKQDDKIYTKRNGENVVLFAAITKEYEGHTDYIPMEWHEKILMALSCDEVYINGERVTKNGSYEIDHDNYTYTDCGIKLLRATFKVTTNVTQRNSNY